MFDFHDVYYTTTPLICNLRQLQRGVKISLIFFRPDRRLNIHIHVV